MPVTATRIPQQGETAPSTVQHARFVYRYAYGRSADSRVHGAPGQDYLALRDDHTKLAFALCDGVSQSFLGELAARVVGDDLVEWMWTAPATGDAATLSASLQGRLAALTDVAASVVDNAPLPADAPRMLIDVLEQKRSQGSESTLVAGLIDPDHNRVVLAWLGDSRIRVWNAHGEVTREVLGDTFLTRERWSTRRGPIGQPHVYVGALENCPRIAAYSDGLAVLDEPGEVCLPNRELAACMAAAVSTPTSDDMSFLEIVTSRESRVLDATVRRWGVGRVRPIHLAAPCMRQVERRGGRVRVEWAPVAGATQYEVEFLGADAHWLVEESRFSFTAARGAWIPRHFRVRARGEGNVGPWSQLVQIPHGAFPVRGLALAVACVAVALLTCNVLAPRQQTTAITDTSSALVAAGNWSMRSTIGAPEPLTVCQDSTENRAHALVPRVTTSGKDSIQAGYRLLSSGSDPRVGLLARYTDDANFYLAAVAPNFRRIALFRNVNGTMTFLGGGTVAAAPNGSVWPTLRLSVDGDHLQVFSGGDVLIDAHDSTFANGSVGLWSGAGATACFASVSVQVL